MLRAAAPLLLTLALAACAADLRSGQLSSVGASPESHRLGRALLEAVVEEYGLSHWHRHRLTELEILDEWRGPMGVLRGARPWDGSQALTLRYENGTFNVQAELSDGRLVGVQAWRAYRQEPGAAVRFAPDAAVRLTLPATQYLQELPFRLQTAPIAVYDGDARLFGRAYHRLFVTWNEPAPHAEADQYLLWVDPETHRMPAIDFTVRERGAEAVMRLLCRDFRRVDGVLFPFVQTYYDGLEGRPERLRYFARRIALRRVRFDSFDAERLFPDPTLEHVGDRKPGPAAPWFPPATTAL